MKNRRIEFRCTDEEYEAFQERAQEKGVSVAAVIRESLIPPSLGDGPRSFVRGAIDAATSPKGHPDLGKAGDEAATAAEIKRLAMQRHPHLPLVFAERKVKEELR